MELKTNLHFHTSDDPVDRVEYSTEEGIDEAARLGFDVLAITCHTKVIHTSEYENYAKEKGVLLLSGVELNIGEEAGEDRHVVVLNCTPDIESVRTFSELKKYKEEHPEIFVLAPHPYFPSISGATSLMEQAERHIHLFDAVEHSWFYSKLFNKNRKAEELAHKNDLPFIATSDAHFFDFLNTDYCVIEANEKTPEAVFEAIKAGNFRNVTRPKGVLREMCIPFGSFLLKRKMHKMFGS